ncbi:MAG: NAD(P)/FAD-dependent oxidoreductase [Candidatus Bathyarchaeota archaeon]|nr:NAD(P)/FAD-dependent oxidoreductase [Candidatus Bathyarchaeota archaeon]MDW8040965.1 NAD(P)/FAD-dependent oxidoreductase [Nitrososphaerota archaeon]
MIEVAIVGGGPAGAYCAYNLAKNGIPPTIFDHSHPREKPCGGMISPLAQELFPFLKELPIDQTKRRKASFVSPFGKKFTLTFRKNEAICVSRLDLDQYLLNMALREGAKWVKEKVLNVRRKGKLWKIKTNKAVFLAEKLVGADGVNSLIRRKVTSPLKSTDKGFCCGYFAEHLEDEEISFHFLPHREGYMWIIPRKNNTSIGIGCSEPRLSKGLFEELNAFIRTHYPNIKIISKWAALIPNIKEKETFRIPIAGPNWLLVGDAAGHVDPLNGEGIPYALLSGELAAQAIAENNLQRYELLWRQAYGSRLLWGVKLRKWMYKKHVLECYCQYLRVSNSLLARA